MAFAFEKQLQLADTAFFSFNGMTLEVERVGLPKNTLSEQQISTSYRKTLNKYKNDASGDFDLDSLDLDEQQELLDKNRAYKSNIIGRILLVGWKNVQDDTGKIKAFDRKNAIEFMKALGEVRPDIVTAIHDFASKESNYLSMPDEEFDVEGFASEAEDFTSTSSLKEITKT